jgi:hypothetical protein
MLLSFSAVAEPSDEDAITRTAIVILSWAEYKDFLSTINTILSVYHIGFDILRSSMCLWMGDHYATNWEFGLKLSNTGWCNIRWTTLSDKLLHRIVVLISYELHVNKVARLSRDMTRISVVRQIKLRSLIDCIVRITWFFVNTINFDRFDYEIVRLGANECENFDEVTDLF